ncbi:MAG: hypothetical protein HOQ47_12720, partial [Streptomyces sp.]|nr:hypothetical protein [Streptomyces sp.]NUR66617.1 hypothetical protein [Streptomyces sp.]
VNATTVANWFIVVLLLTLACLMLRWQIRRARAADAERDRLLFGPAEQPRASLGARWDEDAQKWTSSPQPARAVLDTEPGVNLAAQDACELIWDMAPRDPGPERLKAAIRREQQKGEQA